MRATQPKRQRSPQSQRGTTLVELVIAVGILVLAVGTVGRTVFSVLSIDRTWRDDVVATRVTRQAMTWLSRDAINASSTSLADGAPAATTLTLTWADTTAAPHSASYQVSAGVLTRTLDGGNTITLARGVSAVAFSRSGKKVTASLTVLAANGQVKSTTVQAVYRGI